MGIRANGWCGGFTGIRIWYYDTVTGENVTLGTTTFTGPADFSLSDFSSADFNTRGASSTTPNVEWLSQGGMPLLNGNYA